VIKTASTIIRAEKTPQIVDSRYEKRTKAAGWEFEELVAVEDISLVSRL
jgi:hypothetical protein